MSTVVGSFQKYDDDYYAYPYRYIMCDPGYRTQKYFKEKELTYYYSLIEGIDTEAIREFSDYQIDEKKWKNILKV
ncbi:MAG: hypothetical protein IE920_10730 [Thiotrichales bacterium]|nr:hypothetical protein [Thiotrichales bacterium]